MTQALPPKLQKVVGADHIGAKSRSNGPVPHEPLRAGMTVVIQSDVVTRDGTAGVQTGEMVLVTETGIERMHKAERGMRRLALRNP